MLISSRMRARVRRESQTDGVRNDQGQGQQQPCSKSWRGDASHNKRRSTDDRPGSNKVAGRSVRPGSDQTKPVPMTFIDGPSSTSASAAAAAAAGTGAVGPNAATVRGVINCQLDGRRIIAGHVQSLRDPHVAVHVSDTCLTKLPRMGVDHGGGVVMLQNSAHQKVGSKNFFRERSERNCAKN